MRCNGSWPPLDNETRSRIAEIEKTLAAVASQLSSSEAVKLPDGSSVRGFDLDTHLMLARIEKQLATTARSSAELAEAVKKRGRVVIDTAKLEQHTVRVLDTRLAKAVELSIGRVEQTLAGFERQVAELGAQRTVAAAQEVERVVTKADEVLAGVRGSERRLAALEGKVVWTRRWTHVPRAAPVGRNVACARGSDDGHRTCAWSWAIARLGVVVVRGCPGLVA
jgi:hypothetical protein